MMTRAFEEQVMIAMFPLIEAEMGAHYPDASSIAATRIAIEVLRHWGIPAAPLTCRIHVYNPKCRAMIDAAGRRFPNADRLQQWMQQGAYALCLGDGETADSAERADYPYHMVTLVDGYWAVDLSIARANRPEHQIVLTPFAVTLTPEFLARQKPLVFHRQDCLLRIEHCDDGTYRQHRDWSCRDAWNPVVMRVVQAIQAEGAAPMATPMVGGTTVPLTDAGPTIVASARLPGTGLILTYGGGPRTDHEQTDAFVAATVTEIQAPADYEVIQAAAAMRGLVGDFMAIVAFITDPTGLDSVYECDLRGHGVDAIQRTLAKGGIGRYILVPGSSKTRVIWYDPGSCQSEQAGALARHYGVDLARTAGHGENILGAGSPAGQRARCQGIIDANLRKHPERAAGWPQLCGTPSAAR